MLGLILRSKLPKHQTPTETEPTIVVAAAAADDDDQDDWRKMLQAV